MKMINNMHVLLLKGGFGSERDVSLETAKACSGALKDNGYKVTEIDISVIDINDLINIKADVCFNALHGNLGENGSVQGLLNLLKLPYTHSGVTASAIAMNKMHFKRLLINATENSDDPINFPKTLEILSNTDINFENHKGAYVIKPINGGSSVGVKIIREGRQVPLINNASYHNVIAEEYVGSKELTVTVLKDKPLCVTEIKAGQDKEFYNYKAKYEENGSIHDIPANIPKNIYNQAMSWALRAHQILGCKGISRSDFRYDNLVEKLYMLEINTQPGMTKTSLSPEQALFCKISLKDMVRIIIEEASYEC